MAKIVIDPVLLALACRGDSEELDYFLHREEIAAGCSRSATQRPACSHEHDDVEGAPPLPAASSLLEGVTVEGDTALHAVATHGDGGDGFVRSADVVCRARDGLLLVQNNRGDTPLHCAARAGNAGMVSHLIALAADNRVLLMETENKLRETAMHEAVRVGSGAIVEMLMEQDVDLASSPADATSPLYMAVLLEDGAIAEALYSKSRGILSYSGPNGQNALHAAALRGPVLTGKLLEWKKSLSTEKDENGSTPLHFAAALVPQGRRRSVCSQLLEANPAALYQPDRHGLFHIHVAASVGATETVAMFLRKYPSSAGLRDANGRTFLHVAVEKKNLGIVNQNLGIVNYACRNRAQTWILNMRDKDEDTALHLAVQSGSLAVFCALFGNQRVRLNLTNEKGQTPLDISRYKIPPEMFYKQNSEAHIRRALTMVGSRSGASRQDHFEEAYKDFYRPKSQDKNKDAENMRDTTQNLSIGSVLIATVTFGATFALPGGYRSDDHANGGTPTLAGRYVFDAYMMANMLAFICSSIATVGFMFSGTCMVNLESRRFHLLSSVYFMAASVTSLTAAFALGVYMVLAPVAYRTAVAMCVLSPLVLLWKNVDFWKRWLLLAGPFYARKGLRWTLQEFTSLFVQSALSELWPFIVIFSWAAYARS